MFRHFAIPVAALWAVAGASGWQGPMYDRVIVTLPYPVVVQEKTLPPGEYTIEEHRSTTNSGIVHIMSDTGMTLEATVTSIPALDNKTPEDTSLVLNRYGNEYYLNKMWIQGKNYGYEFRLPDSLKSRE